MERRKSIDNIIKIKPNSEDPEFNDLKKEGNNDIICKKIADHIQTYGTISQNEYDMIESLIFYYSVEIDNVLFFVNILDIIYDSGYKFTPQNYKSILVGVLPSRGAWKKKYNSYFENSYVFKNLEITDEIFEKMTSDIISRCYWWDRYTLMYHISYDIIDMKKNGKYFLMTVQNYKDCHDLVCNYNVKVTKEVMEYRKKHIKEKGNIIESRKISELLNLRLINIVDKNTNDEDINCTITDQDIYFSKCKNIEDIDLFKKENKYKINAATFVAACQNYMAPILVEYILTHKIYLQETDINIIIDNFNTRKHGEKSYIYDILVLIISYGHALTQKNYIEIAKNMECTRIFNDKYVVSDLVFDNNMLDILVKNDNMKLDDNIIENLMATDPHNKNNIMILCCSKIDNKKKVNLIKKYNFELNSECLLYTLISGSFLHCTDIFKNHNVTPDIKCLRAFIEITHNFSTKQRSKYKDALFSLF